ncbi:MAG: beta-ketoacyl synthase N-terminal-like domain-containing protein, partial [Myxococcota bacterium]
MVVVEASVIAGGASGTDAFFQRLRAPSEQAVPLEDIDVELKGLRYPPKDLEQSLPQQLAVLSAAQQLEILRALDDDQRTRVGIVIGMQTDADAARSRWRFGPDGPSDADQSMGTEPLEAARVLGCMPNLIANRLSFQFDIKGPCFVVSAEQASGHRGIEWAVRQLRANELDVVIVGAIDLVAESVTAHAIDALGIQDQPGDGAVLLVLQRRSDAVASKRRIFAAIEATSSRTADPAFEDQVRTRFGRAHVSDGLMRVAAAARAINERSRPSAKSADGVKPWLPSNEQTWAVAIETPAWMGPTASVALRADDASRGWAAAPPQLAFFAAESMDELLSKAKT